VPANGSVTLTYGSTITAVEVVAGTPAALQNTAQVTHNLFNKSASLNASSSPAVSKVAAFEKTLAAGAGTIDLTALTGSNGGTLDGTGLKVQAVKFSNPATNTYSITVETGASNGYELAGATFSVQLEPGQEVMLYGNGATPEIGSTAKTLDLTGTGSEVLDVIVVMG
jgi:hypothetical protein